MNVVFPVREDRIAYKLITNCITPHVYCVVYTYCDDQCIHYCISQCNANHHDNVCKKCINILRDVRDDSIVYMCIVM